MSFNILNAYWIPIFIASLVNAGNVTDETVAPLMAELNNAINTTTGALSLVQNPTEAVGDVVQLLLPILSVRTLAVL